METVQAEVVDCPLCSIPERESLLYDDGVVYLVSTKIMKGHNVRVMACIHRHTEEPSFNERVRMLIVLYNYMSVNCMGEWYILDNTFCSISAHSHYVACDSVGTVDELKQLSETPRIRFPLNKIMIGIPAHNEEAHIGSVIRGAKRFGDVVVYNDGSTDKTTEVSLLHGACVLNAYSKTENKGYGYALKQLFDYARVNGYQSLVTLDGDGQHNPDEIINLLSGLCGSDVVIGNRFIAGSKTPLHRELFIKGISFVTGIGDSQSGYRAYNRDVIDSMKVSKNSFGASHEILMNILENGYKVSEVPVSISYEDNVHSESPVAQGWTLAETVFWTQVWGKPLYTLGGAFLAFALIGTWFIGALFNEYYMKHYFAMNLAILGTGFYMASLVFLLACMFVLVNRKLYRELKK